MTHEQQMADILRKHSKATADVLNALDGGDSLARVLASKALRDFKKQTAEMLKLEDDAKKSK